jgi:hypothetical protein
VIDPPSSERPLEGLPVAFRIKLEEFEEFGVRVRIPKQFLL